MSIWGLPRGKTGGDDEEETLDALRFLALRRAAKSPFVVAACLFSILSVSGWITAWCLGKWIEKDFLIALVHAKFAFSLYSIRVDLPLCEDYWASRGMGHGKTTAYLCDHVPAGFIGKTNLMTFRDHICAATSAINNLWGSAICSGVHQVYVSGLAMTIGMGCVLIAELCFVVFMMLSWSESQRRDRVKAKMYKELKQNFQVCMISCAVAMVAGFFGLVMVSYASWTFSISTDSELNKIYGVGSSRSPGLWLSFIIAVLAYTLMIVSFVFFYIAYKDVVKGDYNQEDAFDDEDESIYRNQLDIGQKKHKPKMSMHGGGGPASASAYGYDYAYGAPNASSAPPPMAAPTRAGAAPPGFQ
uniref:Uncharacterized protein n=1 Tax=Chromera velia CCMP2878 TaxID=1169474 RepID=A0A0G4I361_9ALVE|eukprot:Cvel_1739.t1-p1 / transcript=Cvel_1739.t1 / gene=Cvel_1739 / organism=Chromera_velia_CCMP2878 / gene_product=hypothetical protein / transcript_product=hypothetical protein / location=Cvel_scaffold63:71352-73498(+) / protein_length=357 / sequence_SO=supercontig / SO=protein_coding / is_pseudo=false